LQEKKGETKKRKIIGKDKTPAPANSQCFLGERSILMGGGGDLLKRNLENKNKGGKIGGVKKEKSVKPSCKEPGQWRNLFTQKTLPHEAGKKSEEGEKERGAFEIT